MVFPVGVAALRPGMEEDGQNRKQNYRLHRKYIDDIRYKNT